MCLRLIRKDLCVRKKSSLHRQLSISFRTFVNMNSLPEVVMILVYLPWAIQQSISFLKRNSVPLEVLIAIFGELIWFQFDHVKLRSIANQLNSLLPFHQQDERICSGIMGIRTGRDSRLWFLLGFILR